MNRQELLDAATAEFLKLGADKGVVSAVAAHSRTLLHIADKFNAWAYDTRQTSIDTKWRLGRVTRRPDGVMLVEVFLRGAGVETLAAVITCKPEITA